MKNRIGLVMLCGSMALASCVKINTKSEEETVVVDSTAGELESDGSETSGVTDAPVMRSVTGTVVSLNQGKDGYTAEIKDTQGSTCFATISIPNLDDPKQYKALKVGDKISVTGEEWEMDGETHIKATVLE